MKIPRCAPQKLLLGAASTMPPLSISEHQTILLGHNISNGHDITKLNSSMQLVMPSYAFMPSKYTYHLKTFMASLTFDGFSEKIIASRVTQESLMASALADVDAFCEEHSWLSEIHRFVKSWSKDSAKAWRRAQAFSIEVSHQIKSRILSWKWWNEGRGERGGYGEVIVNIVILITP